ncbi:MAG: hypothetical protein AAFU72_02010 [Pseudomonadota bacterium]
MTEAKTVLRVSPEMRRLFGDWRRGVNHLGEAPGERQKAQGPATLPSKPPHRPDVQQTKPAPMGQLTFRRDGLRPVRGEGWIALDLETAREGMGLHRLRLFCLRDGEVGFAASFEPAPESGLRPVYSASLGRDAARLIDAIVEHRPSSAIALEPADAAPERAAERLDRDARSARRAICPALLDGDYESLLRAARLRVPEPLNASEGNAL